MKRHILLFASLLAVMSLTFISCSKDNDGDDDGGGDSAKFSFNKETLYLHYYDNDYMCTWPELSYSKREDVLQLGFGLYKQPSTWNEGTFDIKPLVSGSVELTPFVPSDLKKGDKLEIISRRVGKYSTYTCIMFDFMGVGSTAVNAKYSYIYTSGTIIFEGYDSAKKVVTLKFNNVGFKGNDADETCVMNGTMKCIYNENGTLTLESGDFY